MATGRLSLAQQIAQLEDTAPVDFDPEDAFADPLSPNHDDQDGDEANNTGARSHYVDVGPSALRKLNAPSADPKYGGVRTSRRQLDEDSDDEDMEDEDDNNEDGDGDDLDDSQDGLEGESDGDKGSDRPPNMGADEDEDEESSDEDHDAPQTPPVEPVHEASSSLRQKRAEDIKKGKAISRQIALWDSLLDARIRLQKSVTAANRLPVPSDISRFTSDSTCQTSLNRLANAAALLSDELLQFRETLIEVNDTTIKPPPRKRRRISDTTSHEHASDINSVNLATLRATAADAAALDAAYHPHLVQTLAKWSAKVQAVAPHVLLPSQKTTFSQRPANNLRSAPSLVDDALAGASGEKLLARTRVRRGKAGRIGTDAGAGMTTVGEGEEDEEGFDDADFYQQLLRDVIDARSGAGQDGAEKEWMVSQKARKAKKVVDTKASKGRRLRYEVHEKLQNFMVPVPVKGQWHEEQIDELFASLLGKGFEHAIGPMDDEEVVGAQPVSLEGLRVFG